MAKGKTNVSLILPNLILSMRSVRGHGNVYKTFNLARTFSVLFNLYVTSLISKPNFGNLAPESPKSGCSIAAVLRGFCYQVVRFLVRRTVQKLTSQASSEICIQANTTFLLLNQSFF